MSIDEQSNFLKGRTITVTGANGHLGNVLVWELLERGARVKALLMPGEQPDCLQECLASPHADALELVHGDVLDSASLRSAIAGSSLVFHLAGIIAIRPGFRDKLYATNVKGTRNVLQASRESCVDRVVYVSSVHALVEPPRGVPITEYSGFDSRHVYGDYGKSKALASLSALDAVTKGLDVVLVCPSGIIGPYDYRPSELGSFIVQYGNKKIGMCVNGAYDFVDVRDVAEALMLAAEKGRTGDVYLISGERTSIRNIMESLSAQLGTRAPLITLPAWLTRIVAHLIPLYSMFTRERSPFTRDSLLIVLSNSQMSSAKAKRELGYRPRPLAQTLAETVGWFTERGLLPRVRRPQGL